MKRFAVVLLSVLLVLLPGCTKPVTESGTAESTAEALSSTESGAENTAEKAEHITQTLSSALWWTQMCMFRSPCRKVRWRKCADRGSSSIMKS